MIKGKKITVDLLYSITAVGIMNVVLQFMVYPILNYKIGAEVFGEILFFLGVVNVLSPSFGISVNNTRLLLPNREQARNRDFLFTLSIYSMAALFVVLAVTIYKKCSVVSVILFAYIVIITMFRNYSCVEYRLDLNYRKQFVFYMILSVGYAMGLLLFFLIGRWELIFIAGETAAVFFVVLKGNIYKDIKEYSKEKLTILYKATPLAANYIITNLMLNLDRIALTHFIGNEAVSQYYVLSLMGKTISIISGPLNGILIGYLTKDEARINRRGFFKAGGIMVAAGMVFWAGCAIITPIYIRLMYPNLYNSVIGLNLIVNLSQIFYFLAGILVVVTLTVRSAKSVLCAQVIYSAVFIVLAILLTPRGGIRGFSYAALVSNALYFAMIYLLGFSGAKGEGK